MKNNNKIFGIFSIVSILLFASCGSSIQEKELKPQSTTIDGPIGDYFEIVNGNYKIEKSEQMFEDWIISVKFKRTDKKLEFNPDNARYYNETYIALTFLDEQGRPLKGFETIYSQDLKNALNQNSKDVWIKFIADNNIEELPENMTSFSAKSNLVIEEPSTNMSYDNSTDNTNNDVNTSQNSDVITNNSNENWDNTLNKYEKFADDYIKHTKKIVKLQKKGDNTSLTEIAQLMPTSMQLNQDALELSEKLSNASGDLTSSQITRFTKIQTKFAKAALELSN